MGMRRLLPAMLLLAAATGCGRSGPGEKVGSRTFAIELPPAGAGAVDLTIGDSISSTCPTDCGPFTFQPGARIRLQANGDAGDFAQWLGDAASSCGSDNPCEYTATSDQMVSTRWTARVSVTTSGGGASVVSSPPGIDCPSGSCVGDFDFGSTIELAASGIDSVLEAWDGACAGDGDFRCRLAMNGDHDVIAYFGSLRVDLYGTVADEYAEAIAADPLVPGGYVVAGSHEAPMVVGTANVPWTAGQDTFLARFDGGGAVTWVETIGGAGDIRPHALSVADDGDGVLACYVGGSFTGAAAYDTGVTPLDPQGGLNGFLGKYRVSESEPRWWYGFPGAAADNASLVAGIDTTGTKLAITGVQAGQMTIPAPVPSTLGGGAQANRKHGFTAVLGSSGSLLFAVHHGKNAAAHAEGNAVLLSTTGGTITAGGRLDVVNDTAGLQGPCASATNPADIDAWLYSLSSNFGACGINQSTKLRATGKNQYSALAWGPPGTFLAAGYTRTAADLGPTFTQFDTTGAAIWTENWTGATESGAFAAAWDAAHGEWVVAGSFDGTITIDGTDYTSTGNLDVLVVWLSPTDGTPTSVRTIGGAEDDVVGGPDLPDADLGEQHGFAGSALAVLPDGTALVAGWSDSPQLGRRPNAGGGNADFFVLHVVRGP